MQLALNYDPWPLKMNRLAEFIPQIGFKSTAKTFYIKNAIFITVISIINNFNELCLFIR